MCGGGWRTEKGRVNSLISPGQRKPCDVRALHYSSNTITYYLFILFYSTLLYSTLLYSTLFHLTLLYSTLP